jgi:hypothetical protein
MLSKTYIINCYNRTKDFRYKSILTAIEKQIKKEKELPCSNCKVMNCYFRNN